MATVISATCMFAATPGLAEDCAKTADCQKAQETPTKVTELDPTYFYFIGGKIIGPRGFSVGDPSNWSTPVVDLKAVSKSGKISIEPEDLNGKPYALAIKTSREKAIGQLSLYGPEINLAKYENAAELAFNIKVQRKPDKDVKIGLDCNWPCRAEVSVGKMLRKQKKGEWTALSVPLNCFKSEKFDLSKINGVFLLSTEGRMEISIADIRLERLPAGAKGCAE